MAFDFSNPLALLAFIPASALAVFIYYRFNGRQFHGGLVPLLLRLLVFLFLVLALSGLEIKVPIDHTELLFVADVSDSTLAKREEMAAFILDSLKILPENYEAGIVVFGENALIEQSLGSRRSFHGFYSKPNSNYSNIDHALQKAEGLFGAKDSRKRIVLLTDGAQNMGDAVLRAGALAQRGIPVDVYHMDTSPPDEVQLSSLNLPSALYQGESYDVQAEIHSTVEAEGILRLFANRTPVGSLEVHIQKGRNLFLFRQTADTTGTVIYEAELEILSSNDTFRQNNRTASYVRIQGPPVVALVEGQEEDGRELAKIMEAGGLEYKLFTPHTLPDRLEELLKFDAVVLSNVDYDTLGREKTEILDSYVKSMGRGLLVTGGDSSYILGGYLGTRLEEMLPVDVDLSKRKDIPSLALALVIDKSSSMSDTQYGVNKMELAKEAAIRSMDALRDEDFIGVAAFDNAAAWVVELQSASNREEIEKAVGTIQPGGGTNLYPGLNMAYEALSGAEAVLKHVIILTDGHTQGGNFDALVSKMAAEGITVSGVAVGQGADVSLMERLAGLGNGRYYFTDDFAGIPKIFTKETYMAARSYINNETFFPKAKGASDILRDIDSVPSLDGYITTTIKDGAVPVLVSPEDDDPILAHWDYGLGKVAAWTSDARGIWTENWLKWEQASEFWLNTISSILPGSSGEEGSIETGRDGNMGQVTVSVDSLDADYETYAVIVGPGGEESRIKMQPLKPGYYQGTFELETTGVYLVRVEQKGEDGKEAALEAGLVYPYSPEYDIRQISSKNLSEHIAGQTGGRLLEKPEDILPDEPQPVWRHYEIRLLLLLLSLLLFFTDILIRRLGLKFMADKLKLLSTPAGMLAGALASAFKSIKGLIAKAFIIRKTSPKEASSEKPDMQKSPRAEAPEDFTSALLEARRKSKNLRK